MINSGREFSIKELTNYTKLVSIKILYITFYTFKQNGPAKCIKSIILGMARLIGIKANLLKHL